MGYIVKGTKYTPSPEGLHNAVCVDIVDLGVRETPWGKKEKIRLVWELDPTSAGTLPDGRRYTIGRQYTPSLHEKAQLAKDLKAWRGRAFTPEELAGFDLDHVLHAPCKLLIQHQEKDGTVYANITAITKADKEGKLLPSGEYIRVKDRPEQETAAGTGMFPPDGEDMDAPPF